MRPCLATLLLAAACTGTGNGSGRSLEELDAAVRRLETNQPKWVLWRSTISIGGVQAFIPYTPEDAYAEKEQCYQNIKGWIVWAGEKGYTIEGDSYTIPGSRGLSTRVELRCLPETVDPRQPRGQ